MNDAGGNADGATASTSMADDDETPSMKQLVLDARACAAQQFLGNCIERSETEVLSFHASSDDEGSNNSQGNGSRDSEQGVGRPEGVYTMKFWENYPEGIDVHPLVIKHGTEETALSVAPEDLSQIELVSGMLIRGTILREFLQRHALENRSEEMEAALDLRHQDVWTLRCQHLGEGPHRDVFGFSKCGDSSCNCRWSVSLYVLNETEVQAAKAGASRECEVARSDSEDTENAQFDAQIAAALLLVGYVDEAHMLLGSAGHAPEPFLRDGCRRRWWRALCCVA
jgi:hypothetical protein